MVSTLSPLLAGGRATIAGRFSPKTFFDRLERSRADLLLGGADDLHHARRPPGRRAARHVRRCGSVSAARRRPASSCSSGSRTRYGFPLIEGYGLSEGTCASTVNPLDGTRKPGTVGLPLPGQTIRIADAGGAPVPDGEAGEVLIAGPNVMRGYLNRPEETAKTVVDGWLHTGDIGRLDEDGYLVLVDRAKDMIIRGGENIYPEGDRGRRLRVARRRGGRRGRAAQRGLRRGAGAVRRDEHGRDGRRPTRSWRTAGQVCRSTSCRSPSRSSTNYRPTRSASSTSRHCAEPSPPSRPKTRTRRKAHA